MAQHKPAVSVIGHHFSTFCHALDFCTVYFCLLDVLPSSATGIDHFRSPQELELDIPSRTVSHHDLCHLSIRGLSRIFDGLSAVSSDCLPV